MYPRPTYPQIEEDEYYEEQIAPKLDELLVELRSLYDDVSLWILDIVDAFRSIMTIYNQIIYQMPWFGHLIDVSLYVGLCAFVLGSSALAIITRRK